MIEYFIKELDLDEKRKESIKSFAEISRLLSYIQIIKENPTIIDNLKAIYPEKIKDNWDCIVELYRYNIKLSKTLYPYLAILENVIKVRLSNYLYTKYGDNFWFNTGLFYGLLELDDFDNEIINKYFYHKINKIVREQIIKEYLEHDTTLSRTAIKTKLGKIRKAIAILSEAIEYRFKRKTSFTIFDFLETKPTLNYWITLLEVQGLYYKANSKEELELKLIFPNVNNEDVRTLRTITQKLDDIRLLRNAISHYNRIIYTNIAPKLDLWKIYTNIIEILKLLGCDDINYLIGDITCCSNSDFEILYHKFDFLHEMFKLNRH